MRHLLCSLALVLGLLTGSARAQVAAPQHSSKNPAHLAALSPVIWVERPGAVQQFTVDPQQAKDMVNSALLKLTSAHDIATAWHRLGITPQDTVGIKISVVGGPALSSHPSVVKAIYKGLEAAGVPASQIIIWSKFNDKMGPAGYPPQAASGNHPAVQSITANNWYDPAVYYKNGMVGSLIWGDFMFNQSLDMSDPDSSPVETRSYYTKFETQTCTKIISVPVLTDNQYVGINGCLATLALGSVDNNRRFVGPPTYGDPAIDEILDKDFLRRKVVVHILDALVAECAGGPTFQPQFCQSLGAIYVSRDPVAVDSIVLPRLEHMRQSLGVPPIGATASHVRDAVYYHLGTTDRSRIQLIRIP